MSSYRLYSMSRGGNHIVDVDQFNAAGDIAAISSVKAGEFGVPRELWNLGRKVLDFAPRPCLED